jgi:hypothetical protein
MLINDTATVSVRKGILAVIVNHADAEL